MMLVRFSGFAAVALAAGALLAPPLAAARPLANPPRTDPALIGLNSLLSVAFSNESKLSRSRYQGSELTLAMADGTRVSGLLLGPPEGELPLIVANFGALSDHWSKPAASFVNEVWERRLLPPSRLFIMDSITSASFLKLNGAIGLGGYDEGRLLLQVTDALRSHLEKRATTVHLLGVSLGGQAAIQALIEEERLGTRRISSAIAFSAAVDYRAGIQSAMAGFGRPLAIAEEYPRLPRTGKLILKACLEHFEEEHGQALPYPGDFFYRSFSSRLERLSDAASWNPAVSRESVEKYVLSSAAVSARLTGLSTPLILVHAKDDAVLPYSSFKEVLKATRQDPNVLTLSTRFGGHWGFFPVYGRNWMAGLVSRLFKP
jgi:pimeloyl-ACP methyl ester carboxylesterase